MCSSDKCIYFFMPMSCRWMSPYIKSRFILRTTCNFARIFCTIGTMMWVHFSSLIVINGSGQFNDRINMLCSVCITSLHLINPARIFSPKCDVIVSILTTYAALLSSGSSITPSVLCVSSVWQWYTVFLLPLSSSIVSSNVSSKSQHFHHPLEFHS